MCKQGRLQTHRDAPDSASWEMGFKVWLHPIQQGSGFWYGEWSQIWSLETSLCPFHLLWDAVLYAHQQGRTTSHHFSHPWHFLHRHVSSVSSLESQMVLSVVVPISSSCFIKLKVKHALQLLCNHSWTFYKSHKYTHTHTTETHTPRTYLYVLYVCMHIYRSIDSSAYTDTRVRGYAVISCHWVSSSIVLHLPFWDRVSQLTWHSPVHLDWLPREFQRSSCLCLSSTWVVMVI